MGAFGGLTGGDWRKSNVALFALFVAEIVRFVGSRGLVALVLSVMAAITEGISIFMLVPILDAISLGSDFSQKGGERHGHLEALIGFLGRISDLAGVPLVPLALSAFGIAILARAVVVAARKVVVIGLQIDYFRNKQLALTQDLAYAPWQKIVGMRHARVTQLLSHELNRVGLVAIGLISGIVALLTIAVLLGFALLIAPEVALLAILIGTTTALISRPLLRLSGRVGASVTATNLKMLNDVGQFLNALKMSVSQNLQSRFVAGFAHDLASAGNDEINYVKAESRIRIINTAVLLVAGLGTAIFGLQVMNATPAILITVLIIISRLAGPADTLFSQGTAILRALPAYREMLFLERDIAHDWGQAATPLSNRNADIEFDRCTYRYEGKKSDGSISKAGVSDIRLTIPRGSFFGICGASGAGKTTLLDLLVGLYPPQEGTVRIGGRPVELVYASEWREYLAYVPQDPFLRNGTVLENLLFGAHSASAQEIDDALAISGANEVIERLPDGLATIIGERGALISGGERQRIAIAASLLRQPELLILDEATNAIDLDTEERLLSRLDALRPNLTIVIVAHRMQSLGLCDYITVMAEGRIVTSYDRKNSREYGARRHLRTAYG